MRVRRVAGGIFGVLQIKRSVSCSLRTLALDIAVALRGINVGYKAFLRLEVVGHPLTRIGIAALPVDGLFNEHTVGIADAFCEDQTRIHIHRNAAGVERHVLIFHLTFAIKEHLLVGRVINQGVGGLKVDRCFERRTSLGAILVQTVDVERIDGDDARTFRRHPNCRLR